MALAIFRDALTRVPEPDPQAVEFLLRMRIGWIAQEAEWFDEARKEYERAVALAAREADQVPQLHWDMVETCRAQEDLERAHWAARNVLSAEAAGGKERGGSRPRPGRC